MNIFSYWLSIYKHKMGIDAHYHSKIRTIIAVTSSARTIPLSLYVFIMPSLPFIIIRLGKLDITTASNLIGP